MKKSLKVGTSMAPLPVVMVSCGDMEKANITTIAWTGIVNSEPPLVYVSIRPNRYSYEIIKESKEFVINIPDKSLVWATDYCGNKSGSTVDKFKEAELTKQLSEKIKAPAIAECPINLECKVQEIKHLGTHDMFIAEIIAVQAEEKYLNENGVIQYENAELLTYAGTNYLAQNTVVREERHRE